MTKGETAQITNYVGVPQRAKRLWYQPCILAVLFSVGAWSQTQLATVLGTVSDPSGAVVPGVSVTIVSRGTGLKRGTLTDTAGEYRFAGLPTGNYSLRKEKAGFQSQVRELAIGDLSQQTTIRELRNGPAPRA